MPYPYGMTVIEARNIIDTNEDGLELVSSNWRQGKAYKGERARKAGPYSKSGKVNFFVGDIWRSR